MNLYLKVLNPVSIRVFDHSMKKLFLSSRIDIFDMFVFKPRANVGKCRTVGIHREIDLRQLLAHLAHCVARWRQQLLHRVMRSWWKVPAVFCKEPVVDMWPTFGETHFPRMKNRY